MESYKFIVNPVAGGGKAKAMMPKIKEYFRNAGADFDIYQTRGPCDAIEAASRSAEEGFDIVVAVGGDGTLNEVLNGLVGTKSVLAVIHGGKGNDFATAVHMPREPEKACRDLLRAETKDIDLGKVLDRYFINTVGVGLDAAVALRVNRGVRPFTGVSAYIYAFFETLLSYKVIDMEIDLGNIKLKMSPFLVAVGIGQAYGGGMKVLPDAIQDDGLFDICVFNNMNRLAMAYHFPKVFSGKLKDIEQAGMYRAREVKLKLSEVSPLHLEGEILFGDRMHFTLEPGGMTVICGSAPN